MSKKLLFLCAIVFACNSTLQPQTINLSFPYFAGAEYDFYLFQGVSTDTIQRGVIGEDGNLTLTIPDCYKEYVGMAQWTLRSGGGLSFVIYGKDFSVSCTEAAPKSEDIIYKGNPENDFITQQYPLQQRLLEKVEVMRAVQRVYQTDINNNIYQAVENELKLLKETFRQYQHDKRESTLYAARYLRISDFVNYIPLYSLSDTGEEHKIEMLRFVEEELDMDALFTTGLWKNVILQSAGLYENGDDFISAIDRKSTRLNSSH